MLPDSKGQPQRPARLFMGPEQNERPFLSLMGEESGNCTWGIAIPRNKKAEIHRPFEITIDYFSRRRSFLQIVDVGSTPSTEVLVIHIDADAADRYWF